MDKVQKPISLNYSVGYHQTALQFLKYHELIMIMKHYEMSLCFIENYAMKTYGGVEVKLHHSWPRQQIQMSGQFPRAGMDDKEKRKLLILIGLKLSPSSP
jgi:hypothetical protein